MEEDFLDKFNGDPNAFAIKELHWRNDNYKPKGGPKDPLFIWNLMLVFKNGMRTPLFGSQEKAFEPNKKFTVPVNKTIRKIVFYAGNDDDSDYIGGLALFDENEKQINKAVIGANVTSSKTMTIELNQKQFWVGMIAKQDAAMHIQPIFLEIQNELKE